MRFKPLGNTKPGNEVSTNSYSGTSSLPQISLPKGGGAIKSIDDKFSINGVVGTAGFSLSFPFSPSRNAFMPALALNYNSGKGNGIFGLGWDADPASIARKTERTLPQYNDAEESDIFIFTGVDDLVPSFHEDGADNWVKDETIDGSIKRYKPRIEGGFARIERIKESNGNVYWKVTSKNNVVSIFGKSKSAQIFDPENELKIYKWFFEFSYDDKGNCYQFEYKKDDKVNVPNELHEKNRLNNNSKCTNTYLKRVKYCNGTHLHRTTIDFNNWETFLNNIDYLLELVLDYGEHHTTNPQPDDNAAWICRQDAFSDYRSGFDIRTWRICQRLLMFHHFSELGDQPCLVRSLNLEYDSGNTFTFLKSLTQKGFIRKTDGTYSEKSLPPVVFTYEPLGWDTSVRSLPKDSLENLPAGIDSHFYQWIDLYNEGLAGIFTEQATGWFYKSNEGDGKFSAAKLVSPIPSINGVNVGTAHFQDLEASGQRQLVSNTLNGFYELGSENEWAPFKNFVGVPNIDLRDPKVKLLDLNGDGKTDILISEEDVFVWYASKGKEGFESSQTTRKDIDEENGPNIVFEDKRQAIALADMSGDGLMDIVRIRANDIVYWPNLGYGRFGAKVSMSNAPQFDQPDHFNPEYLKLFDLDGSGLTSIVYLAKDSFKIYYNQAGNRWSEENIVHGINPIPFPKIDDHSNVNVIDLLGNGTGCIVWSSPLPEHAANPLRYIDLSGGKKPHIMKSYKNNMGKEYHIEYKPSTYFYLQDKEAGTPWVTKLPFVVQCVSKVIVIDDIRKTRFTSQYSYHHGYFDHKESEFRGFGRVDQTDTEDFENYKKNVDLNGNIQVADERLFMPPVLTKTWFHTGAFLDKEKVFDQFAHEYYKNEVVPENIFRQPHLPLDWSTNEWREALRACKGTPLRTEIYALDGDPQKEKHPYTTNQHTCLIQRLQPILENRNGVFLVLEKEGLSYTYERNPADPRIAHNMNVEVDEFGNVLKSAAISYGRKTTDPSLTSFEQFAQAKTHTVFSENSFTNAINTNEDYHLPVGFESKTFELTGLLPSNGDYFSIGDMNDDFALASLIAYENVPTPGTKEKRLIEHVRTLFLKNDLSAPLTLGTIESLVLPFESYQLSLTPALRDAIFGAKVNDNLLLNEGKYVHFSDDNYWIPSGTQVFDAIHFYQVTEMSDPFGFKLRIQYDAIHHLFAQKTTDALNNESSIAGFNFRTLSPYLTLDINDNISGVRYDELGMAMSTFVTGKINETVGDLIDTNVVEASVSDQPSTVLEYDLFNYLNNGKPNFAKITVREKHHFDTIGTSQPGPVQIHYTYIGGSGEELLRKSQAEPGIALQENPDGTISEVDTTPDLRWIGIGRTILNNKGKPVKAYEPYFSTTFEYEDAKELIERGVSPILYYDPIGRAIRSDLPNGTFNVVEFDAWMHKTFDANDMVLKSQWYKERIISPDPVIATPQEISAANKAAIHADTPAVSYLDSLGRIFLSVADNGGDGKYKTSTETDIEGNVLRILDARGNVVMEYKYDMLGGILYQDSMDAGKSWLISDVLGKPLHTWDTRNHECIFEYDVLHRLSIKKVGGGDGVNPLNNVYEKIIYGEDLPNNKIRNLRGKVVIDYDTSGKMEASAFDFKGNPITSSRRFLANYKDVVNWDIPDPDVLLEPETFSTSLSFDALNRITHHVSPDNSTYTATYNERGILKIVQITQNGVTQEFVKNIDYNEKGQRKRIIFGNDVSTNYNYDNKTFRLIHLETKRINNDPLQDLFYTFDPVGNISQVDDKNIPVVFFNNQKLSGVADYTYDSIYRLIKATGREHAGQLSFGGEDNWDDLPFHKNYASNSPLDWRNYSQQYQYDSVGNILQMKHIAGAGSWTRDYTLESSSNRLISTQVGANIYNYPVHPTHGFITAMPHLTLMQWNFNEELQAIATQQVTNGTPETTYYVYDASGLRTRKITERQSTTGSSPTKKSERIYVGGIEIYREYNNSNNVTLERQTYHVSDGSGRIAMIETRTKGTDEAPAKLVRYQLSNHLTSTSIETDENARVISYEEYHPYGTTSYQANDGQIKAANKRYRYTGMERDEESGLNYHSARYYIPWLARWLNADPIGVNGGLNLYEYSNSRPTKEIDTSGTDGFDPQLWFSEARVYFFKAVATITGRGFTPKMYDYAAKVKAMWGGPAQYDLGHMDKPFSQTRAGESGTIGIQDRNFNRSQGGGQERLANAQNRASGNFARVDDVDLDAQARANGKRIVNPKPPAPDATLDPKFRDWKPATPPVKDSVINVTPKAPASGGWQQLELPFGGKPPVRVTTPTVSPTVTNIPSTSEMAKDMAGDLAKDSKFSVRMGRFSTGLKVGGGVLQVIEIWQYSKLIDDVKEWGEAYQKYYDEALDNAWGAFHGTTGGNDPTPVPDPVVVIPPPPKRNRGEQAREDLIMLGRQIAVARQRAQAAPAETAEPTRSGGGSSSDFEMVLNPYWTPTGIPWQNQPMYIQRNQIGIFRPN